MPPDRAAELSETADPGKRHRLAEGIPVVPAFDGYRAYAILGLVILHSMQFAGFLGVPDSGGIERAIWAADIGQACVDTLFVVSGFVVFLPTVVRGGRFGDLRAFAIRRVARLVPAFWFVLLLILLLLATVPVEPPLPFPSLGQILLTFTTLEVPADMVNHTYFLGFGVDRAIWTLSPELIFYLLLPLVAGACFRRPFLGVAAALALTVGWKALFNHVEAVDSLVGHALSSETASQLLLASEIQFPYWAFSFAVGIVCARLYVLATASLGPNRLRKLGSIGQTAAVLCFLAMVYATEVSGDPVPRHSPLVSVGYTTAIGLFMLSTSLAPWWRQAAFSNRPIRWLADVSYGTYLIHLVIATYVGRLLEPSADKSFSAVMTWIALVVPASVVFGYLSARFLERPIRRRAQRYARERERIAAAR